MHTVGMDQTGEINAGESCNILALTISNAPIPHLTCYAFQYSVVSILDISVLISTSTCPHM